MRKRLTYALVVSALTAGSLLAQQASETIEVRVTNVDVVVTDRDGRPIHGLTKDDFLLYENRKPQQITNFYEIRADLTPEPALAASAPGVTTTQSTVVPAEMRSRSLVVFIDNSSIDPLRRNQAIDETWSSIDKLVRRGDDAMLVTWDHHAQVLQPFTTDTAALKRALDSARAVTASASTISFHRTEVVNYAQEMIEEVQMGRKTARDAYAESVSHARAYAEWVRNTQQQMLQSLTQTISTLAGIDGKKVLIFVGGEMQEKPGLDTFQQVDSLFLSILRNITPAAVRELELNQTGDLDRVARNANANGVTLYMINVADRSRSAADGSMQRLPDPTIEFTQEVNTYLSMEKLASDTGGAVINGTTNYSVILDTISRDLGSYYSLGYKPPANAALDRTITVKVKRPGASVRARRAYAFKTADEQLHDRIIANAFHPAVKSDFPVTIEAAPEPFQNGLVRVKVTLTFPGDLTYLPDGQDLTGEYDVYFVTASDDGSLSPLGKQAQTVRFPASALTTVKQNPLRHGTGLVVKPGSMVVSAAVVDKLGGRIGFARANIVAR